MTKEEFDQKVEEWHGGAGAGLELHEYLGMTWDEYCNFVGFAPRPEPWELPEGLLEALAELPQPPDNDVDD